MNIFLIPSWYPYPDKPMNGIFIYEQAMAIGKLYPEINIGISLWGQKDERLLLWGKDHIKNLKKLLNKPKPYINKISFNLIEYHQPEFIYTRKINKGNIDNIIAANIKNLKKFEQDFGPVDLIHAQVAYPAGYVAMRISEILKIPYVLTEQMAPFPMKGFSHSNGSLKKIIAEPYAKAAMNFVLSPSLKSELAQHQICNTVIVPNLLDENFFKPAGNKINQKHFTFFTLGSMIDRKGISELLQSAKILIGKNPNVQFKIGGEGEKAEDFKKQAQELGIDKIVKWLGSLTREQARDEFQNCDAFVLPSRHESMGVVYAEAIACGKPIIATRCGGPESIVNKNNGLLVEVGDVRGLANAMQYMINHYDAYDPKVIRQDFLERFSSKVVAAKIVDLYKQVIAEHQSKKAF